MAASVAVHSTEVEVTVKLSACKRFQGVAWRDLHLKNGAPKAATPPVFIYNTGENHWDRLESWPLACESGAPPGPGRSI